MKQKTVILKATIATNEAGERIPTHYDIIVEDVRGELPRRDTLQMIDFFESLKAFMNRLE